MSHLISLTLRLAVLSVMALAVRPAIADDAVILASTVPGYAPGMIVAPSDRLSLPEGASATLLFQSGGMLRLRGPFEGTLVEQQPKTGETTTAKLADLFRLHGVDATVIGGTRSTLGRLHAAEGLDDVHVDPQHSGTYCLAPATSIWITRPVRDGQDIVVRHKGASRTLAWPAGSARVEWPADVPIEDGNQFAIAAGGAAVATVTFHIMPAAATAAGRVASGIVLGCHEQFDEQLHRISRSAADPEIWMTTDHGRRANYRVGETVALTIVADTDGYLYCVADGSAGAIPIFPRGAIDGAQLRGSVALSIPGRRQPIGLTATVGMDHVRCWLADRDITPELPHALLAAKAGRLPDQVAGDLDGLFLRIGGTRLAADTVSITVE